MEMTPIVPMPAARAPFIAAVAEVNQWRGRCLNCFATVEFAVSELLCAMQPTRKLPLLQGARLDELTTLLRNRSETAKSAAALARFGGHNRLRHFLCHGRAEVLVNEKGVWLVRLEMIDGQQCGSRSRLVLFREEAEQAKRDLHSDAQRVLSSLSRLLIDDKPVPHS